MATTYNFPAILDIKSFNTDALTTPSATQEYELGTILNFVVNDQSGLDLGNDINTFMYVRSHTALVAYQPYVIKPAIDFMTAAPVAQASGVTIGIPQIAVPSGYYFFIQISGICMANLIVETHVPTDYLELLEDGAALVVDGTSGSTVFSPKSVAIQIGTSVGAKPTIVRLFTSYRTALVSAT